MLTELLSDADVFVATFSRPLRSCQWIRAVVSGTRQSGLWRLRIESFTERQAFTSPAHEPVADLDAALAHLLSEPFRQILLQTPAKDHHIVRSFKSDGVRVAVTHSSASRTHWHDVTEDRAKHRLLTPEQDAKFLHVMDLATADGRIKAPMADKFRQVNHLLHKGAQHAVPLQRAASSEIVIIDAGCGKAYLSLSLVYVLERMGHSVSLIGIDSNQHVIEHCNRIVTQMGFKNTTFICSDIRSAYEQLGRSSCDLLIALHACDTATDDALELGLRLSAEWMLVAPCCHHYLQKQLRKESVPNAVEPLLDDGITRERLGDLVTDTMRRDILRWQGYDAHLEEFVSLEHTQKNVLLTAKRKPGPKRSDHWRSLVEETVAAWGASCSLWDRLHRF